MSRDKRVIVPALLLACACGDRRKPIELKGDAGPAVVVVEPNKRPTLNTPVALIDEVEPDDDLEHAQPMAAGKGVKGTIHAPELLKGKPRGDVDVYSYLEPGTPGMADGGFDEARIELTGVVGLDLVLEVLAGDGTRLWTANDGGPGEPEVIPNLAFEAGHTYYLKVRALGDKSDPVHAYELVVHSAQAAPSTEREPNDDVPRATHVHPFVEANGFYSRRRDEDWLLAIDRNQAGTAGQPAIARIELGPVEGIAPSVRVYADGGARLLAEARAGRGEEIRMRNVGLGADVKQVFLQIRPAEGKNVLDRWMLRLGVEAPLEGAEHEPNDSLAQAEPLLVGAAPMAGFLWPGDQDLYKLSGASDMLFTAEVDGVDKVDLRLDHLAPDGKQLVRADDAGVGQGERLPPWPLGAGAILRVSARAKDAAFDAPYHLTVAQVAADPELEREPNDTIALATSWREGAREMHGFVAPRGDEDVYRFVAPPGKTRAVVSVKAPGVNAAVRLTDENRAPLGPAQRPDTASGPVVAGKSYFITVKSQDKSTSAREPYHLTLTLE